ncbi:MAG TPA: glucosamine-6-phosphate deaminase, partial [Patescibacteria group bacterium]|nr:glucosamine-6-phosphate deaminase [Patescibacteria group bacterium]
MLDKIRRKLADPRRLLIPGRDIIVRQVPGLARERVSHSRLFYTYEDSRAGGVKNVTLIAFVWQADTKVQHDRKPITSRKFLEFLLQQKAHPVTDEYVARHTARLLLLTPPDAQASLLGGEAEIDSQALDRALRQWIWGQLRSLDEDARQWMADAMPLGSIAQALFNRLVRLIESAPLSFQEIMNSASDYEIFKFLRHQPLGQILQWRLGRAVAAAKVEAGRCSSSSIAGGFAIPLLALPWATRRIDEIEILRQCVSYYAIVDNLGRCTNGIISDHALVVTVESMEAIQANQMVASAKADVLEEQISKLGYEAEMAYRFGYIARETLVNGIVHGQGPVDFFYSFTAQRLLFIVANRLKESLDLGGFLERLSLNMGAQERLLKPSERGVNIARVFLAGYRASYLIAPVLRNGLVQSCVAYLEAESASSALTVFSGQAVAYEAYAFCATARSDRPNQDYAYADGNLKLLLVADGMGGRASGEEASRLAVQTMTRVLASGLSLAQTAADIELLMDIATVTANEVILTKQLIIAAEMTGDQNYRSVGDAAMETIMQLLMSDLNAAKTMADVARLDDTVLNLVRQSIIKMPPVPKQARMGTTISAVAIGQDDRGQHFLVARNIGDSRIYLIAAAGEVLQLSADDSYVAHLMRTQHVDEVVAQAVARLEGRQHKIVSALGRIEARSLLAHQKIFRRLDPADVVVGVSDGLWRNVTAQRMRDLLRETPQLAVFAKALVAWAVDAARMPAGTTDDISAAVVAIPAAQNAASPVGAGLPVGYPVVVGAQLQARYPLWESARLKVYLTDGKIGKIELSQGTLEHEQGYVLQRRLQEALISLPCAPPAQATIEITPETSLASLPAMDQGRLIAEYNPASGIIRLHPVTVESEETLAYLLGVPVECAQYFMVGVFTATLSHLSGVTQEESYASLLEWFAHAQHKRHLEAAFKVLEAAGPSLLEGVAGWKGKLGLLQQAVTLSTGEPGAAEGILLELATAVFSDADKAIAYAIRLEESLLAKDRQAVETPVGQPVHAERGARIDKQALANYLKDLATDQNRQIKNAKKAITAMGVGVVPVLKKHLITLNEEMALAGEKFPARKAAQRNNVIDLLESFFAQNGLIQALRNRGKDKEADAVIGTLLLHSNYLIAVEVFSACPVILLHAGTAAAVLQESSRGVFLGTPQRFEIEGEVHSVFPVSETPTAQSLWKIQNEPNAWLGAASSSVSPAHIWEASIDLELIAHPDVSFLKLVESYSGIRGIFGEGSEIPDSAKVVVLAYAYAYAANTIERWQTANPAKQKFFFVMGRDPRPTSETIAQLQRIGFMLAAEDKNVELLVTDLGIVTTPFIEAIVRMLHADGGVMITASHNPLVYNGFKYLTGFVEPETNSLNQRGGILNASKKKVVIQMARQELQRIVGGNMSLIRRANEKVEWFSSDTAELGDYLESIKTVFRLLSEQFTQLREENLRRRVGIVFDGNGGSAIEISPFIFREFGYRAIPMNTIFGSPAHLIEPVGEALQQAARMLRQCYGALVALVTDFDADRGNLVAKDKNGKAIMLHPQDVVLLNVAGMLAWVKTHPGSYPEAEGRRWAVVVHSATSSRVHDLAKMFGAEIVEVDIGEANVVTRMHELEQEGYFVPIGVEGYNGGTIFMGTEVRDGTLTALMSLLMLSSRALIDELCAMTGRSIPPGDYMLTDILEILPRYHTIQSDLREDGVTLSQSVIKERLEEAFLMRVRSAGKGAFRIEGLEGMEFNQYEFRNAEETRVLVGKRNRINQDGGFKILLTDTRGNLHFIWFRGSKTEAGVFRTAADSADPQIAEKLFELQQSMYRFAVAKTDDTLYAELATLLSLRGIAVDVASGGNDRPAKGLLRGGLAAVRMVDNIFTAVFPGTERIATLFGDATNLTAAVGEGAVEVVVFNRSLPSIIEYSAESVCGRQLQEQGDGPADNLFFFLDILDRVISQAHRVLKPGGKLVINTDVDFIEDKNPRMRAGSRLDDTLSRAGFVDMQFVPGPSGEMLIVATASSPASTSASPAAHNIRVEVCGDFNTMSRQAALLVAERIRAKPDLVLGLATGDTPLGLYRRLIQMHQREGLDFSKVRIFHLDEYIGLPADHEQGYQRYLWDNFLRHLNIPRENIHFLNGMAEDSHAEALRYEEAIRREGGIDLQILGIGNNGHIAFNEPGSAFDCRTGVVDLTESTIEANSRFFTHRQEVPRQALSQGIGTILQSKEVILLANGLKKVEAVYKSLYGQALPEVPASALQLHPRATFFIDQVVANGICNITVVPAVNKLVNGRQVATFLQLPDGTSLWFGQPKNRLLPVIAGQKRYLVNLETGTVDAAANGFGVRRLDNGQLLLETCAYAVAIDGQHPFNIVGGIPLILNIPDGLPDSSRFIVGLRLGDQAVSVKVHQENREGIILGSWTIDVRGQIWLTIYNAYLKPLQLPQGQLDLTGFGVLSAVFKAAIAYAPVRLEEVENYETIDLLTGQLRQMAAQKEWAVLWPWLQRRITPRGLPLRDFKTILGDENYARFKAELRQRIENVLPLSPFGRAFHSANPNVELTLNFDEWEEGVASLDILAKVSSPLIIAPLQNGYAHLAFEWLIRRKLQELAAQGHDRPVFVVIDGYAHKGKSAFSWVWANTHSFDAPFPVLGMEDARGHIAVFNVDVDMFDIKTGKLAKGRVTLKAYLRYYLRQYAYAFGKEARVVILQGMYSSQIAALNRIGDVFVEVVNRASGPRDSGSIYEEVKKNFDVLSRFARIDTRKPLQIPELSLIIDSHPPYPATQEIIAWFREKKYSDSEVERILSRFVREDNRASSSPLDTQWAYLDFMTNLMFVLGKIEDEIRSYGIHAQDYAVDPYEELYSFYEKIKPIFDIYYAGKQGSPH